MNLFYFPIQNKLELVLYWPKNLKYDITFDPDPILMYKLFEKLKTIDDSYLSRFNVPEW